MAISVALFSVVSCSNQRQPDAPTFEQALAENAIKQAVEHWHVDESTSEMDGSKTVQVTRDSTNAIETWNGMQLAELVIRCQKKALEVYVVTHVAAQLKGEYSEGIVRLKFDESKPEVHAWFPSTDYKALFSHGKLGQHNYSQEFVARAAGAKMLLFEFTPFQKAEVVLHFGLDGLAEVLPKLESAGCRLPAHQSARNEPLMLFDSAQHESRRFK